MESNIINGLMQTQLVVALSKGNHDNIDILFMEFASYINCFCSDPESWHEKHTALITLEKMLNIYSHIHSGISQIAPSIIMQVVQFITELRLYFHDLHTRSQPRQLEEDMPKLIARNTDDDMAKVSTIEVVETTYIFAEVYKHMQLSQVLARVNSFYGTSVNTRQLYANYQNIKQRKGDDRSSFMPRLVKAFNDRLNEEDMKSDCRRR